MNKEKSFIKREIFSYYKAEQKRLEAQARAWDGIFFLLLNACLGSCVVTYYCMQCEWLESMGTSIALMILAVFGLSLTMNATIHTLLKQRIPPEMQQRQELKDLYEALVSDYDLRLIFELLTAIKHKDTEEIRRITNSLDSAIASQPFIVYIRAHNRNTQ